MSSYASVESSYPCLKGVFAVYLLITITKQGHGRKYLIIRYDNSIRVEVTPC